MGDVQRLGLDVVVPSARSSLVEAELDGRTGRGSRRKTDRFELGRRRSLSRGGTRLGSKAEPRTWRAVLGWHRGCMTGCVLEFRTALRTWMSRADSRLDGCYGSRGEVAICREVRSQSRMVGKVDSRRTLESWDSSKSSSGERKGHRNPAVGERKTSRNSSVGVDCRSTTYRWLWECVCG